MFTSPTEMLKSSLLALAFGFLISWIFDIPITITDNVQGKFKKALFFITDFVYIFIYSILLILVLYYFNGGLYRGVYLVSLLLGTYIYYFVFSKVLRKITKIILMPLHYFFKFLIKIFAFLVHSIEKIEFKLYNNKKEL